jgi:hypothetical protein
MVMAAHPTHTPPVPRRIPLSVTSAPLHFGGPPDLGPLRVIAERAEMAEAVAGLTDAYGYPLADADPWRHSNTTSPAAWSRQASPSTTASGTIPCTGSAGYACSP